MTRHQIQSPSNSLIKHIRKLKLKKYRIACKEFIFEGLRPVTEALRTQQPILQIIYCPKLLRSQHGQELIRDAEKADIDVIELTEEIFLSISEKEGPQGIAAVARQVWRDENTISSTGGLWVALESVQDAGNLGSILRSSDAAGAKGVILLEESADPFHPTSIRASTGAIFTQSVVKASFTSLYEIRIKKCMSIIGTISQSAMNYSDYNYPKDMILLMGSEQKGLSQRYIDMCDALIHIPMVGCVDSLNLSNATAIILFAIKESYRRMV